jgi:hypothetical protein
MGNTDARTGCKARTFYLSYIPDSKQTFCPKIALTAHSPYRCLRLRGSITIVVF